MGEMPSLSQYQLLQVALDNHVLNRAHRDLEQVGVGRVGKVSVYFFFGIPAQGAELIEEVLARRLVIVRRAVVIGKAVFSDGAFGQLFSK